MSTDEYVKKIHDITASLEYHQHIQPQTASAINGNADAIAEQADRLRRELVAILPLVPLHIQYAVRRNMKPGDLPD